MGETASTTTCLAAAAIGEMSVAPVVLVALEVPVVLVALEVPVVSAALGELAALAESVVLVALVEIVPLSFRREVVGTTGNTTQSIVAALLTRTGLRLTGSADRREAIHSPGVRQAPANKSAGKVGPGPTIEPAAVGWVAIGRAAVTDHLVAAQIA